MSNEYVTIKINQSILTHLMSDYKAYQKDNKGEYIAFFATYHNITITAYFSSKHPDQYKVVFNGENARKEALKWSKDIEVKVVSDEKITETKQGFLTYEAQYGSDEVGFGDFFGPLVVVSVYLDRAIFQSLNNFIVSDSKKLTDDYIITIAPLILPKVKYKVNIVDNEKLNSLTKKGYNMNKIKAMLHLNVLSLLKDEVGIEATSYIDKFASEVKFSEYTSNMKPISPIVMKEKGESLYPSVALASMLARYFFLVEMSKLETKFKVKIPLGASLKVDEFALDFKNKYGMSALDKIVKQNFSNYKKLVS